MGSSVAYGRNTRAKVVARRSSLTAVSSPSSDRPLFDAHEPPFSLQGYPAYRPVFLHVLQKLFFVHEAQLIVVDRYPID